MLVTPPFGASSNIALWRAYSKPPVELVVADLERGGWTEGVAMFSGKREKALLEEELATLRETEKRERELLHKIAGQKDTAEEQFARMTASRAQMEKEIEEIA